MNTKQVIKKWDREPTLHLFLNSLINEGYIIEQIINEGSQVYVVCRESLDSPSQYITEDAKVKKLLLHD